MQGQALVDYVKRVMDLEKDVYTNQQIQNRFDKSFARRKPLLPPKPELKRIIENLNQIKNNQFVLYNELVSANQKVTSVLADIDNNVKINAYQNEAAAKNAEALKYISLIKR